MAEFNDLIGLTLVAIKGGVGDDEIRFLTSEGREFRMYHEQDCCESVSVEDICGDLADLIGSPILRASGYSSGERPADVEKPEYEPDSETWTFYNIATVKGYVTIRWYGTSNGSYSESVYFEEITKA